MAGHYLSSSLLLSTSTGNISYCNITNYIQLVNPVIMIIICHCIVMPEAPLTPPSVTSHNETKLSVVKLLKKAFTNKYFILFLLTSGT